MQTAEISMAKTDQSAISISTYVLTVFSSEWSFYSRYFETDGHIWFCTSYLETYVHKQQ